MEESNKMADKWYNSTFAEWAGTGIFVLGFGLGIAACLKGCQEPLVESAKSGIEYKIQASDLNGNGKLERFYAINDNLAVVEIDEKPTMAAYANACKD